MIGLVSRHHLGSENYPKFARRGAFTRITRIGANFKKKTAEQERFELGGKKKQEAEFFKIPFPAF